MVRDCYRISILPFRVGIHAAYRFCRRTVRNHHPFLSFGFKIAHNFVRVKSPLNDWALRKSIAIIQQAFDNQGRMARWQKYAKETLFSLFVIGRTERFFSPAAPCSAMFCVSTSMKRSSLMLSSTPSLVLVSSSTTPAVVRKTQFTTFNAEATHAY
jgi:hypothetical protein